MPKEKHAIDPTTRLADAMEQQNSFLYRFGLGIITGLGTAIGATIVFAIVIFILVQILQSIGWEDKLKEWGVELDTALEEKLDAEVEGRLRQY